MRFLTIGLRIALFAILFLFCVRNLDQVTLRFYFGIEWTAPLALLLFVFFVAGVALGVLAILPHLLRARRRPSAEAGVGAARTPS